MSVYARTNDPLTSWEAAETITDDGVCGSQQYVLSYLRVYGPCIAEKIETSTTKWRASRIRTALTELERDGLAHPTDSYGRTERGRKARKWEAAETHRHTPTHTAPTVIRFR